MQLNAQLETDVVALQAEDDLTCLVTFQAPVPADVADRSGETLVIVVDRSGSMSGDRMDAVRSSLHALVDRLRPQDSFGVVTFDTAAEIAVPIRPMRDHHAATVHGLIEGIDARGTTDLSAGYLLGLSEARRNLGATGATVLLLSDGEANAGITDPAQLGALAEQARADRITTGSIGIGAGYDETLLAELATRGHGPHRFAYTPDDAAAVVAEESGDLLSKSVVNAFLRVTPHLPGLIDRIGTLHDVPRWVETGPDGDPRVVIPLGDFYAGEQRELLVQFSVPAIGSLGAAHIATFTIDYVAMPQLASEQIAWPVSVNVVPGDEAAGRVPNPTVTTARLIAETTATKKAASQALRDGEFGLAEQLMTAESAKLRKAAAALDDGRPESTALRALLLEEQEQADRLARSASEVPVGLAQKSFQEDITLMASGRSNAVRRQRNRSKRDF